MKFITHSHTNRGSISSVIQVGYGIVFKKKQSKLCWTKSDWRTGEHYHFITSPTRINNKRPIQKKYKLESAGLNQDLVSTIVFLCIIIL